LLLFLLSRLRLSQARLATVIALGAVALAVERFVLADLGASANRLYNGLDTRADALLFGAAAGVAFRMRLFERWTQLSRAVGWAGAAASVMLACHLFLGLGAVPKSTSLASIGSHTVVGLGAVVVILALTTRSAEPGWLHKLLAFRPLQEAGKISYGLYLWHYLLFTMLDEAHVSGPEWFRAALKCGVTLAVAVVSYHALERPCLRLKGAFAPAQAADRAQEASFDRRPEGVTQSGEGSPYTRRSPLRS
jgi:peptidoglycan/LPS O-acetylase OafA/YrhL